ncbi:MAG: Short chain enoyl-CoA hydratase [Frankiales bacterium]|nr:Short chain enoyl-CoA hydratase [Frankiales bacterium]
MAQQEQEAAPRVRVARHGRYVRVVTIDNPPVNALDTAAYRELLQAFEEISVATDVRAVVLTAAGRRAFCAGSDIRDFGHQHLDEPLEPIRHSKLVKSVFDAIWDCPVPVVACINGPALGAGVGLAASCDFIIAADDAVLGLPEINVGVLGGARALARLVPPQRVRLMMYTGRRVPFAELEPYGSVLSTLPADTVLEAALDLASEIAGKSPTAIRLAKKGLSHLEVADLSPSDGYKYEQSLTEQLAHHPDAARAAAAFFEGTTAVFD